MSDLMVIGAWVAIWSTVLINLYLFGRELTRAPPLTFLELFLYFEKHKEDIVKIWNEKDKEVKKRLLELEHRNYKEHDKTRKQIKRDD